MPTIYITDNARKILDQLCEVEKRAISDEIDLLLDNRLKELNIPASAQSSVENEKTTPPEVESQD